MEAEADYLCLLLKILHVCRSSWASERLPLFWPAEWKQYEKLVCHRVVGRMMKRDETTLPAARCHFALRLVLFIISPLGYWFSFLSGELVGPASRPPRLPAASCQRYFTADAPLNTEYTHPHSHTHNEYCVYIQGANHANTFLNTRPVILSFWGISQRIYEARGGTKLLKLQLTCGLHFYVRPFVGLWQPADMTLSTITAR